MISQALRNLSPKGASWHIIGEESLENIHWKSQDLERPSDEQILAEADRLAKQQPAKEARGKRNRLLTESDWVTIRATDTGDPVPTEWQTYRQALRDIPEQTGFPEEIEWPQEPQS